MPRAQGGSVEREIIIKKKKKNEKTRFPLLFKKPAGGDEEARSTNRNISASAQMLLN